MGGSALTIVVVLFVSLLTMVADARAQTTRAAQIAEEQAAKAEDLHPYEPPKAEAILDSLQEGFLFTPSGFFPYFASVYSGGGFTLGAGYRKFIGDNTILETRGLYSAKNYKRIEVGTVSRGLARDRLIVSTYVGFRDATQVAYYGEGIDTLPESRANFRLKLGYVTSDATMHVVPWAVLGGALGYEAYSVSEPQGHFPDVEDVYTPATAPGLGASPDYVHVRGTAAIDSRTSPGYTRTGGYYGVSVHDFVNVNDTFDFKRLDADVVQHIPVLRETWVVSLRGRLQTELGDGNQTPFFLLPSLGSGSTLRAYSSWRFRDRHAWLASAEWRWIPSRLGLDMALFYDTGQVAHTRHALALDERKSDVGVGVRLHSPTAMPVRIDFAHGDEGWHLVFAASAPF